MNGADREAERIANAYERGELSPEEYQDEMRCLRHAVRVNAEEAAERAYREEMERW